MAETIIRHDPSQYFIGGEFAQAAQSLPVRTALVPTFKDLAAMTNWSMRRLATLQTEAGLKEPS